MPRRSTAVFQPNLGLYLSRDLLSIPERAVQDGRNFRVKNGQLGNVNLGWAAYSTFDFETAVMAFDQTSLRTGTQLDIVVTIRDIYAYDQATDTALFLNRRYNTGTVAASGTAVTGTGTGWFAASIKIGDYINFTSNAQRTPTAAWFRITAVDAGGTGLTLATSAGTVGAGTAYTIRRTFTGSIGDIWVTDVFVTPDDGTGDNLWFATNGVDGIVTWDGQATQVVERSTALGFTCKTLRVYKNMMVYGNLIVSGNAFQTSIINSDIGKPLNAGSASTGLAAQFRAHDGIEPINVLETLGDNLVIYAERNVVLAQFVGADLVFIFREAAAGVGPIAGRLLADFGDYHEFIGADSQYLFDGVSVTEIGKQVWREILRQRDATRQHLGWSHFDEENGELVWAIPLITDAGVGVETEPPAEAFIEHYLEEVGDRVPDPVSRRAMPFLCAGSSRVLDSVTWDQLTMTWEELVTQWNDATLFAAFPLNIMGDDEGNLWTLNASQQGAGTALASYVRFGRRTTADGRMRALLTRVYPFMEKLNTDVTVTVNLSDHALIPETIVDAQTFDTTLEEGEHFTVHYRRGRYFDVKFGTSGGPYLLSGYDVDFRMGGTR